MASSQLVRQWNLVQELAVSRRGKTTAELAQLLEVTPRTARRDLQDVEAAGLPVEHLRDGREVRHRLQRSRSLPEIPLHLDEALALTHAVLLSPLFVHPAYHERLESGLRKVLLALPPTVRAYVDRSRAAFAHRSPAARPPGLLEVIRRLQEQVAARCRVRITYQNLKGEVSERLVDPYRLRVYQNDLYLVGHCHLRGELRVFHTERIGRVDPLDASFSPPADLDVDRLLRTSLGIHQGRPGHAVVRFEAEAARYVLHRPLHPDQQVLERADGHLVIRVPVRGRDEITHEVLRFGPRAEVLGPPDLRAHVAGQVRALAASYDGPPAAPD